jgi:hypothetical protein
MPDSVGKGSAPAANPFVSRKARLTLITIGALVAIAGLGWYSQRGWTSSKLERLIRQEVPDGCERSQVEAWFDRHGIKHQYSVVTAGPEEGDTMPHLAGLKNEDLSGMVCGSILAPEANVSLFVRGEITVCFFLDKQGRLKGHYIREFGYMP